MIQSLIVTHGTIAKSLVEATQQIIGSCQHISYYCVGWDDEIQTVQEALGQKIQDIDDGDGVLILTDMFGGTPTNISLNYHKPNKVEIITGVNLPMIMKAITLPSGIELSEAARQLKDQAQKSIYIASELAGSRS